MIKDIKKSMEATRGLWDTGTHEDWLALRDSNEAGFQGLRCLTIRLSLLADVAFFTNLTSAKTSMSVLRALGVKSGSSFLADLGKLQRVCFREHALLQRDVPSALPSLSTTSRSVFEEGHVSKPFCDKDVPPRIGSVKAFASRMHPILARLFRSEFTQSDYGADYSAIVKAIYIKRVPEPAQTAEVAALAECVAEMLIEHLKGELSVLC